MPLKMICLTMSSLAVETMIAHREFRLLHFARLDASWELCGVCASPPGDRNPPSLLQGVVCWGGGTDDVEPCSVGFLAITSLNTVLLLMPYLGRGGLGMLSRSLI